jgi:tetratricopeptide (TPR) repeat protein
VQFISGRKLSTRAVFLWFLTGCLYALCLVAGSLFDFLLLAELLAVAVTLRELEVSLRSPLARVALGLVVLASVGNLGSGFLRLREESSLRLTVASDQDLVAVLQSQVFHRAPAGEGAQVAPMPAQPAVPAEPPQPMPDALDEQLAQAVKLLDGRQYPAAKSAFEAVLKAAEPANRPQARLLATVGLAESHLKTGDSKAALSLIEVTEKDLAAQFRKPPVDFFKLALIKALAQESLQDRAAAIDTLKKALDLAAMAYPQDHTLRWFVADRLSRMLEASGKNDEALRIVKMSIEPFQKDPSVTEQRRALWKERQERLQKAADRPQ